MGAEPRRSDTEEEGCAPRVARAVVAWASARRVGRMERDLYLALVAGCPARGVIIVPGVVVICGQVRPSGLRGRRKGGPGPCLRTGRPRDLGSPRTLPGISRRSAVQGFLEFLFAFLAERGGEDGAAVLAERVDHPVRGGLVHHEE